MSSSPIFSLDLKIDEVRLVDSKLTASPQLLQTAVATTTQHRSLLMSVSLTSPQQDDSSEDRTGGSSSPTFLTDSRDSQLMQTDGPSTSQLSSQSTVSDTSTLHGPVTPCKRKFVTRTPKRTDHSHGSSSREAYSWQSDPLDIDVLSSSSSLPRHKHYPRGSRDQSDKLRVPQCFQKFIPDSPYVVMAYQVPPPSCPQSSRVKLLPFKCIHPDLDNCDRLPEERSLTPREYYEAYCERTYGVQSNQLPRRGRPIAFTHFDIPSGIERWIAHTQGSGTEASFKHSQNPVTNSFLTQPAPSRLGCERPDDIASGALESYMPNEDRVSHGASQEVSHIISSGTEPLKCMLYGKDQVQPSACNARSIIGDETSSSEITEFNLKSANHRIRKGKGKFNYFRLPTSMKFPYNTSRLPLEILERIAADLSRTDVKNLRLVDRHFSRMISATLFKTVVVPFNAQIYGALGMDLAIDTTQDGPSDPRGSAGIDLDIFPAFGAHIRNFGMRFDVNEAALRNPPRKSLEEGLGGFWGTYKWPFRQYRRFQDRADLENAADETPTMKRVFSELKNVRRLGVALDCGLGWLSGPDASIRAKILRSPESMFNSPLATDCDVANRRTLWMVLENCYRRLNAMDSLHDSELVTHKSRDKNQADSVPDLENDKASITLNSDLIDTSYSDLGPPPKEQGGDASRLARILDWENTRGNRATSGSFSTTISWERVQAAVTTNSASCSDEGSSDEEVFSEDTDESSHPLQGFLYTRPIRKSNGYGTPSASVLAPSKLTAAQREWLLETAWAQDAFLTSYMIAVADNASVFANVKRLDLSRFSSRHVAKLCRADFWDSMPALTEVDMKLVADHRDVTKNAAGFAELPSIDPSNAVSVFHYFLKTIVSTRESIKILSIGWVDGGEHAEGLFARNKLLLPAPLLPKTFIQRAFDQTTPVDLLSLPHIVHLELVNCWTTPNALEIFTLSARQRALRKLTLNSVSLTTHPRFVLAAAPGAAQNMLPNAQQNLQQGLQALLAQQLGQPQALGQPGLHNLALGAPNGVANALNALQQQLANMPEAQNAPQQAPVGFLNNLHAVAAGVHGLNQQQQQMVQVSRQLREGSWQHIIERMRSGLYFQYRGELEMELFSCGYARLSSALFDQSILDQAEERRDFSDPIPAHRVETAAIRRSALKADMMQTSDINFGVIVPAIPMQEMDGLCQDLGLQPGWPTPEMLPDSYDDDDGWGRWGHKTKEAAEFDGLRLGGTGRISGRVTNFVAVRDCEDSSGDTSDETSLGAST